MESLKNEIDEVLEREGIPACCIAIMNKDEVIWKEAFGCQRDNQFHYFSGTKLYTATGILKLAEQHKLNLDDYVAQHILASDCDDWPGEEHCDGITIRHLLSHSSGLVDTPMKAFLSANFQTSSTSSNYNKPSSLQALKKYNIKRARAPGKMSSYANVNYAILGYVIERVSGQSYADYIKEHVLKPLGSNACFSVREATDMETGWIGYWNSLAAKLVMDPAQYKLLFAGTHNMPKGKRGAGLYSLADFDIDTEAIGGLVGRIDDFCPLVMELLRHGITTDEEGNTETPKCLSKEMIRRSVEKQFDGQIGIHSKDGAGLGWKIGKDFVNHEGGGPGFASETRCYLNDGIGIVILMNRWSVNHSEYTIGHDICELIRTAAAKT